MEENKTKAKIIAVAGTITSNSDFVQASCSLQSELGRCF